ncbi:unnamed protein product [Bursaphelenchus okinawaensis]|uniref:Gamma-secretase subunit PEN-2 n=1 Tax=Bursaphelenchus okinawaensis TaxID=465554 RepID=A0A811JWA9_9BILA|nr:unnamed protein product [Bursaphelenchus okinawaensis]CAG9085290.1 unnamed protein product [Bursaphelenchus okinawaensis]
MASLAKMNLEERLDLCRKYFIIGFFALPFVWLANVLWFGPAIWKKKLVEMDNIEKRMIKYLVLSFIGFIMWAIGLLIWTYVYSQARVNREQWAESLTFLFPMGRV